MWPSVSRAAIARTIVVKAVSFMNAVVLLWCHEETIYHLGVGSLVNTSTVHSLLAMGTLLQTVQEQGIYCIVCAVIWFLFQKTCSAEVEWSCNKDLVCNQLTCGLSSFFITSNQTVLITNITSSVSFHSDIGGPHQRNGNYLVCVRYHTPRTF